MLFRSENDSAWIVRLEKVGINTIYRIHAFDGDPNTYDVGEPVSELKDGITVVSYPNPIPKVPVWHTDTREVMYISAGTDVPPAYTTEEPPKNLFARFTDGTWTIDTAAQGMAIRAERDLKLTACDWTQLPDCPLPDAQKITWTEYRQALRNIPQRAGFPGVIEWPVAPAE